MVKDQHYSGVKEKDLYALTWELFSEFLTEKEDVPIIICII